MMISSYILYLGIAITVSLTDKRIDCQMFDTHFVELDDSKMVHTGEGHYAIFGSNLPSGWKIVSVNGDEISIVNHSNQLNKKKLGSLSSDEKHNLNMAKDSLMTIIHNGPYNVRSKTGLAKLTTFDRFGSSSVTGTGGSSSSGSSSSSSSSSGGMSISKTGKHSYIVTKSDFPLSWVRVFVNDDLTTIVYRDGYVKMLLESLFEGEEKTKLIELKQEVERNSAMSQNMANSMLKSMSSPMDFVSKAMSGFGFGR